MHTGVGPISHEFSSVLGGVLAEGQFGEHRLSLTALVRDAARRNLAQKQVSSVLLSLAPLQAFFSLTLAPAGSEAPVYCLPPACPLVEPSVHQE